MGTATRLEQACKEHWQRFTAGEQAAFTHLYRAGYDALYRYGHSLTTDTERVRDAIQETFFQLWTKAQRAEPVQHPAAFLMISLRNQLIDAARRDQVRQKAAQAQQDFPFMESVESEIVRTEDWQERVRRLQEQLRALPDRQREAIYLRYYEAYEYPAIAHIMGVSQQAVYNYVHRGLDSLRQRARSQDPLLMVLLLAAFGWW